jgi:apolipoprotein D and lipocalin family protein
MNARIGLLNVLLVLVLGGCATREHPPLRTAGTVDVARYMGRWYEITRLPNSFQRNDSHATADYTLVSNNTVHVVNTEYRPNDTTRTAEGQATLVPGSGGNRLKVRFKGLASLAPVSDDGNYWIIAVAPDYSVALVGTPDRKFLWLLARQPDLAPEVKQQYLDIARDEGFATERLLGAQSAR